MPSLSHSCPSGVLSHALVPFVIHSCPSDVLSQSSYFWPLGMVARYRDSLVASCPSVSVALVRLASRSPAPLRLAPLRAASLSLAFDRLASQVDPAHSRLQ